MDNSGKYAKSEGFISKGNITASATLKPNLNMALGAMHGPSAYNRFLSHYHPISLRLSSTAPIPLSSVSITLPLPTSLSLFSPPCYGAIQEVISFDFCEFLGEDFSDSETEEFPKYPRKELGGDYPDRVKRVIRALHMSHLSLEEKEYVFHCAEDYASIFHLNGEKLTSTHLIQHRIPTIDDEFIVRKQYRTPHKANDQIHDQIEQQYTSGIIGNSKSPYNSPLLIVPKKLDASGERKWRIVIDSRALNEKVIGDAYPLPNISDIFNQLRRAQYFSVFDLARGFHQVEMHPEDRAKTAFSSPRGHFEYLRIPMGIKNAPDTFQRLMDVVLKGIHGTEVFVCLDDIVVYAESLEEHDKKARRLFDRLRNANLKLQRDKCDFLRTEVAYLSHIIRRDGVKPKPAKIKAIRTFPRPTTVRGIGKFLGLSGYYRKFIRNCAKLEKPLSDLLKKGVKWELGSSQRRSFRKLRRYLCNQPILMYPDFQQTFKLTVGSSFWLLTMNRFTG